MPPRSRALQKEGRLPARGEQEPEVIDLTGEEDPREASEDKRATPKAEEAKGTRGTAPKAAPSDSRSQRRLQLEQA